MSSGISLDAYGKLYEKRRLELRIPVERKAPLYVLFLLGTNKDTADEEIQRRIAAANQYLLNLPGIIAYARRFTDARSLYGAAMFSVLNKENVLLDELANVPAAFPDALRRRGAALSSAGKALTDLSDKIMNSPLVVFDPIFAAASELETLGKGFDSLGSQFEEFADIAGHRKGDYESDREKTNDRAEKVKADSSRLFDI